MKFSKRSNIAVSLSWVFMIIVGTFFIILAYNIIQTYQENEQAKYEIELKQALRNIFNNVGRTAGIEENSLEPIGNIFSDTRVEILCEQGFPILSLNGKLDANNEFLQNYPVFMTYIEQGSIDQTYIAVESLRLPFKVSNMMALVSKKNLIVFDENSRISRDLIDKFKKSSYNDLSYMTYDFSDMNNFYEDVSNLNLNSINFVSDVGVEMNGLDISDLNLESNLVQIQKFNDETGEIVFTNQEDVVTKYNYIDYNEALGLVIMAVLSTPEVFECSYGLILEYTPSIYDFYIQKTKDMAREGLSKRLCSSSLVNLGDDIDGEQQSAVYEDLALSFELMRDKIKNDKFNNIEEINSLLSKIEDSQIKLEEFNCEYVY